jgi:hypothetical protein
MSAAQDLQSLVLSCNKDGMDALRRGQSKAAFEQFKYAESILISNQTEGTNTSLLAVTCNNLGCYYKKVGKLHGALSYLRRALKMEVDLDTDEVTIAGTHLNICAILSKLEKHDKAVQHAVSALDLIKQRVESAEAEKASQDDYSVLAIAYHNVAVERDFLLQYEKAAEAFKQGHEVAKQYLGEDHPLSVTLGKNCDSVLHKSQKLSKASGVTKAALGGLPRMKDAGDLFELPRDQPGSWGGTTTLPPLRTQSSDLRCQSSVRTVRDWRASVEEAADWRAGEERTLESFARWKDLTDMSPERETPLDIVVKTGRKSPTSRKGPSAQALDITLDHPEAMLDIIDADRTGHSLGSTRTVPHDYRPNRVVRGTTRGSRVMRRFARTVYNSTHHRDKVATEKYQSAITIQKAKYNEVTAACKIQRMWRAWYKYCCENGDWMVKTWVCATKIQAVWRSYHVRRIKFDRVCTAIQRHIRGYLVRRQLRWHKAALTIQRWAVGKLTRLALGRRHRAGTRLQALVRGVQGRAKAKAYREKRTKAVVTMQSGARIFLSRNGCSLYPGVRRIREDKRIRDLRNNAATTIQKWQRGKMGRRRFENFKATYLSDMRDYNAAVKMQALLRREMACQRVDSLRAQRLDSMTKAATLVARVWRGAKARQRYLAILTRYRSQESRIVIMQRFARGFVVRLRMWREAIRAEEELWAALEIQRVWRGHLGRNAWNRKLKENEHMQLREESITKIQVFWRARKRVRLLRRKVAREEFMRARLRYRAAVRIQALVRGVLVRKVINAKRELRIVASISIQRYWRGHVMRYYLWDQVRELRACAIQAAIRGHLVRNRRFMLATKTICIQRAWRRFCILSESKRSAARDQMVERRRKAAKIQRKFREHILAPGVLKDTVTALDAEVEQVKAEKAEAIEREDFEAAGELQKRQRGLEAQIMNIEKATLLAAEAVANAVESYEARAQAERVAKADGLREELKGVKAEKMSAVEAEDFISAAELKRRQEDLERRIRQLEDA